MPDWSEALCARTRQPERGYWTSDSAEERAVARQLCRQCPIMRACADWAVATLPNNHSHYPNLTIWGGMTAAERHRRRTAWLAGQRDARWRAEAG